MSQPYWKLPDTEPIRQGDVVSIRWSGNNVHSPDRQMAIVVTADCDIAQNKMGDFYTIVSTATLHDYLTQIWMRSEINRKIASELKSIVQEMGSTANELGMVGTYADNLMEWLRSSAACDVARAIKCDKPAEIEQRLTWVKRADESVRSPTACHKFFVQMKRSHDKKKPGAIAKDIQAAIRQLPMEYMYLPAMPDTAGEGYIVLLRDIRAIQRNALFTSLTRELITAPAAPAGYRQARLADQLKYALAQRFSFLFSRIGLAESYEEERDRSATVAAQSLCAVSRTDND